MEIDIKENLSNKYFAIGLTEEAYKKYEEKDLMKIGEKIDRLILVELQDLDRKKAESHKTLKKFYDEWKYGEDDISVLKLITEKYDKIDCDFDNNNIVIQTEEWRMHNILLQLGIPENIFKDVVKTNKILIGYHIYIIDMDKVEEYYESLNIGY